MSGKSAQAFTRGRVPNFDLAIIRSGNDKITLHKTMSSSQAKANKLTLNSIQARPRSCASNVRKRSPLAISQSIIFPSPDALARRLPWTPTAFTGPSWPRNDRCSARVDRSHMKIAASLPLSKLSGICHEPGLVRTYQLRIQFFSILKSSTPPE